MLQSPRAAEPAKVRTNPKNTEYPGFSDALYTLQLYMSGHGGNYRGQKESHKTPWIEGAREYERRSPYHAYDLWHSHAADSHAYDKNASWVARDSSVIINVGL